MNLLIALALGVLTASGIWLMLRARSFDLILGITLLSYAVNFFIFAMGRLKVDAAPILDPALTPTLADYSDPLPQALVLTAIVIGFAMTALMLVIALRTHLETGTDHVDANEPEHDDTVTGETARDRSRAGSVGREAAGFDAASSENADRDYPVGGVQADAVEGERR